MDVNKQNKNKLIKALSLILPVAVVPISLAETFYVTRPNDNGSGISAGSLSQKIRLANLNNEDDVIVLKTDVKITGVMKRLIDSNVTIQSDSLRRTIDGDNQFRPLFIKSGQVAIKHLDIINGLAKGGDSMQAGRGAGMGGGLFIYDGDVSISNSQFINSKATGGEALSATIQHFGGGGMFGQSVPFWNGGGLFASKIHEQHVNYGGYGYYQNGDKFGQGGSGFNVANIDGGFGGGGGYISVGTGGHGGFGGGGAKGNDGNGGDGGFGAGGGEVSSQNYSVGLPGYGGTLNYAAGMGGAVFVRSGSLSLSNVNFNYNEALADNGAKGLGGGIFILHTISNSNGNDQGMPIQLANINGCGVFFNGNEASGDTNTGNNNDDIFDLANLYTSTGACEQEIQVTGNQYSIPDGNNVVEINNNTDFGNAFIASTNKIKTFKVKNIGGTNLQLNGMPLVEITGANSSSFEVLTLPDSIIGPYSESEFTILFKPTTIGEKTAVVQIMSNDSDESVFSYTLKGTAQGPEIEVTGNGIEIMTGDMTPSASDLTEFGSTSVDHTFIIKNNGVSDLQLNHDPMVILGGADASQFSVIAQPEQSVLAPNEMVSFDIRYHANLSGYKNVSVIIPNNDIDEESYSFRIEAGLESGFYVTEPEDDGTGLVPNSLSWAILQANTNPGPDHIYLDEHVTITGVMKRLIDSDVELKSLGPSKTIDGNNSFRPLFVKSGQVLIENINIENSKAKGGKPGEVYTTYLSSNVSGGGGAGMGGSLFIYDGDVTLKSVNINDSSAIAPNKYGTGSGGSSLYADSTGGHGAGMFSADNQYGGYGNYQNIDPKFGQGGVGNEISKHGGFGAGGAYRYSYSNDVVGGDGGFGGGFGSAYSYYGSDSPGKGGFGGGGGYGGTKFGAAMGGAIFVRSGQLTIEHLKVSNSRAYANGDSKGLGGALFILHTTNHDNGNQQGMPSQLATVTVCDTEFIDNVASSLEAEANNNNNIFDLANLYTEIDVCIGDLIFLDGFD